MPKCNKEEIIKAVERYKRGETSQKAEAKEHGVSQQTFQDWIVFHLVCQELRHFDDTVTLFCFRCGDHILPIQSLIRFADGYRILLKIEVSRGEGYRSVP